MANERRVYCAGPLFNAAERREMLEIAAVLRDAGFEPWVPHADGMEFANVRPWLIEQGYEAVAVGQLLHEAVFALDVYQVLVGCGCLVMNLNGRVPDEGAVAEATMAWMLGKPIVAYKDDARTAIAGRDNPLVIGLTGFRWVSRLEELPGALEASCQSRCDGAAIGKLPAHAQQAARRGEQFWMELTRLGTRREPADVGRLVMEHFGEPVSVAP